MFLIICTSKKDINHKLEVLVNSFDKQQIKEKCKKEFPEFENFMLFPVLFEETGIFVLNEHL